MDAQPWEYTKSHSIVKFKWVNYRACELYLNKATKSPMMFFTKIEK